MNFQIHSSTGAQGQHRHGFTLVEMLLVLAILALLSGILYPIIVHRHLDSQIAATRVQIKAIESAIQLFELDNQRLPQGHNGLLELVQRPANAPNWKGPYLDHLPLDPWGNDYVYTCPGKHRLDTFDLMSYGQGGPSGNGETINNWTFATSHAAVQ